MIKKLKSKITAVIAVILFLVFALQLFTVNIINYRNRTLDAVRSAVRIASKFDMFSLEDSFTSDSHDFISPEGYYVLMFNTSGAVTAIISDGNIEKSVDDLKKYIDIVFSDIKTEGKALDMFYAVSSNVTGSIVVLTDNKGVVSSVKNLLWLSFFALLLVAVISFFIAKLIAMQIVAPVEKTFERQKQFISDAGHELKTPLTVIGVNADLLEREIGDNKWLEYIRSETSRMNGLVLNLLKLAKLDDGFNSSVFAEFDLSKTVEGMSMTFESVAFESDVILNTNIEDGIKFVGDESEIKQLASILIDNAIKHCNKKGSVTVVLTRSGKGKTELSISNEGDEIPAEERSKIFERFYRADAARSRAQNRFGLGLAIAKAIVERHKGHISVNCENGVTVFTAVF